MASPKNPSVLFLEPAGRRAAENACEPDFFRDLNLDQIVDAITAGWDDYDLKPFFYIALNSEDAVRYRHEVFQDLQTAKPNDDVRRFGQGMQDVRNHLGQVEKLYYPLQKDAWFLDAVTAYSDCVRRLASDLSRETVSSRGFLAFWDYLARYARSTAFNALMHEAESLRRDLSKVRYAMLIKESSFTVSPYEGETDYSAEIGDTFAKFKENDAVDYKAKFPSTVEMNHVEAKVLEFVRNLNATLFDRLADFRKRHGDFIDQTIAAFDREIHFYLSCLDYMGKFVTKGLQLCYPRVSAKSKEIYANAAFDLALAQKLEKESRQIVCNDFSLAGAERIIVVSGPNQGGKTTFARMFGQLHYLACLGCPVPAREAQLFLFDRLFAHFEREEKVESLRGKLEDDLTRIHAILEHATDRSVVVLNEVFTSTTLQDEVFLSRKIMETLIARDLLCVWVTFVEELASFGKKTVSMVSLIVPENPAQRTFKVVRHDADGLAYAMAIAEKYGVTYARIKERLP
jgi:DNA mismatch repair protein MutS